MISLSLIPGRRAEQGLWPTRKICGSPVPLDGKAVIPFWKGNQFLMTCVGNGKTGESFFLAAFHAVDQYLHDYDLPKKMTDGSVWEWMSPSIGHDIVLIKVTGLAVWPHPSLPICHEVSPIDYTANPPRGWRGCLISQGEPETQNGTPGTGNFVFWNDENGDAGPYGVQPGYANPVMKRWGELRILSVDPFMFRAGPNRDDLHPGLSYDNSSAPFVLWNERAARWEVLGLTYGGFMSTYRLPSGDEYWENGSGKGRIITAQPEGTTLIVGGTKVSRYGSPASPGVPGTVPADGAVSSMSFNHIGPVAKQIEDLMVANGGIPIPPDPSTPVSRPLVTGIITTGAFRNEYSYWAGCRITVGPRPITVTHLGWFPSPGSTQKHGLRMIDAQGRDVAKAVLSLPGTDGVFNYAALASPVTLPSGNSYYLVAEWFKGGDSYQNWNCSVATSSDVSVDGLVWQDANGFVFSSAPGKNYGPLSFLYS